MGYGLWAMGYRWKGEWRGVRKVVLMGGVGVLL